MTMTGRVAGFVSKIRLHLRKEVRVKRLLLAGVCLATAPAAALAQYPVGYEFLVNSYTTASHNSPAVATDGHGNFVVVWSTYAGVYGRRFSAYGVPLGGDFLVA